MVMGKKNGCITIMIHPFKYYYERYTPAQIFPEGKRNTTRSSPVSSAGRTAHPGWKADSS